MSTIYRDESGFSSPNLYDDPDTHFVYVAVTIEPGEAVKALACVKGFSRGTRGRPSSQALPGAKRASPP